MQSTHDRSDGDLEHVGDLLIGETLDVGEQHRKEEVLGQVFEGTFDFVVGEEVDDFLLGTATLEMVRQCGCSLVEVELIEVSEVGFLRT